MTRDFTKTSTEQLLRSYRFHENDIGTMTADEECRRMCLVELIGAELQRRGVDPHQRQAASRSSGCERCGEWHGVDQWGAQINC